MLECDDSTLYTGITNDPRRRLAMHKAGRGGRYTRSRGAKRFVYLERKCGRSEALSREASIKRLSRAEKEALITSTEKRTTACYDSVITNQHIAMAKGNNLQRKEKKKPK
jgi:putative endonuclease